MAWKKATGDLTPTWQQKDKQLEIGSMVEGVLLEKKTNLGPEWSDRGIPITVRDLLQRLGTDALRLGLHYNTWVNALMADYKCIPADRAPGGWDCDNWIITDTRFPNEVAAIKKAGGIIVRINRPGIKPINDHPSEISLDGYKFDHIINNDGDLTFLTEQVKQLLCQI